MRFAAVGLLMMAAGLLASCSAAHVRPAAQPGGGAHPTGARQAGARQAGARQAGARQAGARQAGVGAPAHAGAAAGSRLQVANGPRWSQGRPTPCGPPALVRAAGHVLGVGCGQLSNPPVKVTLTIGQRIDVHMMLGAVPHSSRPAVLAPGAVSDAGATQTYRADRPGQAVLISDARECRLLRNQQARQAATRTCPVVTINVVP